MSLLVGYLPPYRGSSTPPVVPYTGPSGSIPKTQPVYTNAISHDYKSPPGMLMKGYFYAQSASGYNPNPAAAIVNPAYYYSAANQAYFGPWYQPPPTVYQAPIYIPSASYPSTPPPAPSSRSSPPSSSYANNAPVTKLPTSSYSSYSRRDGSGLGSDLDMAASEVTTSYSGGYVNTTFFFLPIFSSQIIFAKMLVLIHLKTDQPMLNHRHTQQLVTLQPTVQDTLLPFQTMQPLLTTTLDTLPLLPLDMELIPSVTDPVMAPFHSVMVPFHSVMVDWLTATALGITPMVLDWLTPTDLGITPMVQDSTPDTEDSEDMDTAQVLLLTTD